MTAIIPRQTECLQCKFGATRPDLFGRMECRRYPPKPPDLVWPVVRFDSWCGEFKKTDIPRDGEKE